VAEKKEYGYQVTGCKKLEKHIQQLEPKQMLCGLFPFPMAHVRCSEMQPYNFVNNKIILKSRAFS